LEVLVLFSSSLEDKKSNFGEDGEGIYNATVVAYASNAVGGHPFTSQLLVD